MRVCVCALGEGRARKSRRRRRRRLSDGLAQAYQLICLEQRSSHLYLPVQLAAIHAHHSCLWISRQKNKKQKTLPVLNYLTVSCISAFPAFPFPTRLPPLAWASLVVATKQSDLPVSCGSELQNRCLDGLLARCLWVTTTAVPRLATVTLCGLQGGKWQMLC